MLVGSGTGETRFRTKEIKRGCMAFADGMLYCLNNKGIMRLISPSPSELKMVSQFQVPRGGKSFFFAHPVICGGRLYVRHADHLYAYEVKAD